MATEFIVEKVKEMMAAPSYYAGLRGAKKFAAHADELKASGAKYCDCGACKPGQEILAHKAELLA